MTGPGRSDRILFLLLPPVLRQWSHSIALTWLPACETGPCESSWPRRNPKLVSTVGIIANPVSARDIRRVIANATALQITDRANIVLRVLSCLKACGIGDVVMMPENGGIRSHVRRGLDRSHNCGEDAFPRVSYADIKVTGTVADTI